MKYGLHAAEMVPLFSPYILTKELVSYNPNLMINSSRWWCFSLLFDNSHWEVL